MTCGRAGRVAVVIPANIIYKQETVMKRTPFAVTSALLSLALAAASPGTSTALASTGEAELAVAEQYLAGTFDNYEQTFWQEVLQTPEELRHRRSSSLYLRVDLPAFGEHVYYAHKYWDGDPAVRSFRNLYVLSADTDEQALRLDLLTIPRGERLDQVLENMDLLQALTPEEMIRMAPECNTLWYLLGNQFHIKMAGDCVLTSVHPDGIPVHITVSTQIDDYHFNYLSYGVDGDGNHAYGPPDLMPSRELRARWFSCEVERAGMPAERVLLHDQGDMAVLPGSGSTPPTGIRLRQFMPPTAVRSQALVLLVLSEGLSEEVDANYRLTTAHAAAAPQETQIGYVGAGIRAHCSLAIQPGL
jgi:hypothetical protein